MLAIESQSVPIDSSRGTRPHEQKSKKAIFLLGKKKAKKKNKLVCSEQKKQKEAKLAKKKTQLSSLVCRQYRALLKPTLWQCFNGGGGCGDGGDGATYDDDYTIDQDSFSSASTIWRGRLYFLREVYHPIAEEVALVLDIN